MALKQTSGDRRLWVSWSLIGSIVVTFCGAPLLVSLGAPQVWMSLLFFVVQAVILRAFSQTRFRFYCSLSVFIPVVCANAYFILSDSTQATLLFLVTTTVFLAYATFFLLKDVFSANEVNTQTLLNAISAYLLIAIIGAMIHGLISFYIPNSYNFIGVADTRADIYELIYFSVATLTTLGYGDYLPLSEVAKSFVAVEALVGQIYMAVIIARLVGLHIANPQAN